MKNFLFLLVTATYLLGLTSVYAQGKSTNRTIDQLLTDYVKAIQTRDTTALADCFHSSVFPLFETSRKEFANQVFESLNKIGDEFVLQMERSPYQTVASSYKLDGLDYQSVSAIWQTTYRVKKKDKTSRASLKKLADTFRSNFGSTMDIWKLTHQIPDEVNMISLNEKTGELRMLTEDTSRFIYERSKQEWRLVPLTYSTIRTIKKKENKASKSPTARKK